jgi:V8-like Glu-specific endopeptidase
MRVSLLMCFLFFAPPAFSQVATFEGVSIYDLDPKAEQSTSNHILEQMLDNDDMQAISELSPTDVIRVLAKPVGRLTLEFEKELTSLRPKGAYCTASLIDRDLIITNYHCIPGNGNVSNALLTLGYLKPRTRQGVAQYPVRLEPVEASEALDYSILRVEGNPGDEWGKITLSSQTPEALNTLFVVHHPGGFPQYVTRGRCQTNDPAIDGNDILHKCDTLPGSSGAPIFDNNTRKVVGLHYSAVALRGLNAGKRIASISKNSPLIGKLIEQSGEVVERPQAEAPLSEAAQAWRDIQNTSSEGVLETYIRHFKNSVYADFAKAKLDELKRQRSTAIPPENKLLRIEQLGLTVNETPNGVSIFEVNKNSDAESKGLKTGDIILDASGQAVVRPNDILYALNEQNNKNRKAINLLVKSGDRQRFVAISFGNPIAVNNQDVSGVSVSAVQQENKDDKSTFSLYPKNEKSFVRDPSEEIILIEKLKSGKIAQVTAISKNGDKLVSSYSLLGLTDALKKVSEICNNNNIKSYPSDSAKLITTIRDWQVFGSRNSCFAVSTPKETNSTSSKNYFYVTHWPEDGVKNEVSVNVGVEIKSDVNVVISVE